MIQPILERLAFYWFLCLAIQAIGIIVALAGKARHTSLTYTQTYAGRQAGRHRTECVCMFAVCCGCVRVFMHSGGSLVPFNPPTGAAASPGQLSWAVQTLYSFMLGVHLLPCEHGRGAREGGRHT